jgi:glycosyltransferase involved in cell wall biosynthesis
VKILYVSQYFPPEMGAPAARAIELARHWVEAGHEVTVLTGFPNHPTGVVPAEWRQRLRRLVYREIVDGVNVARTWLWPLPNRRADERILNYSSFFISAAVRGLSLAHVDVVIATSPQLLVGLAGWWIARWQRVPFVFEVRDLWPESLAAVGAGSEKSLLHGSLRAAAGFLYRKSRRIVVVTPAFREHLIRHWNVPSARISVVENGVETDLFSPANTDPGIRRQLEAEGKFLVCYLGTMGMAHGLETLVEAASRLQASHPQVVFALVGEGSDKQRIKTLVTSQALRNVRFVDQQPRERVPAYINASDACLVLLKKTDLFRTVVPTKMLEFMACGRPVIVGVEGEAGKIMEEAGAGVLVEPENAAALAEAIAKLAADRVVSETMGGNGRKYIIEHYARKQTATIYLSVLREVLGSESG